MANNDTGASGGSNPSSRKPVKKKSSKKKSPVKKKAAKKAPVKKKAVKKAPRKKAVKPYEVPTPAPDASIEEIGNMLCQGGLRAVLRSMKKSGDYSERMVEILVSVAEDSAAAPRDRKAAAKAILDIAAEATRLGQAQQKLTIDRDKLDTGGDSEPPTINFHLHSPSETD